jgi:hypothetical protein
MNGYVLLISITFLLPARGQDQVGAQVATAQFADFRSCAEAADAARHQIYASSPPNSPRPRVHALCLPQSSN